MDDGTPWGLIIGGLIPSAGVALVFWLAWRAITRADRNERKAQAELDAAERKDAR